MNSFTGLIASHEPQVARIFEARDARAEPVHGRGHPLGGLVGPRGHIGGHGAAQVVDVAELLLIRRLAHGFSLPCVPGRPFDRLRARRPQSNREPDCSQSIVSQAGAGSSSPRSSSTTEECAPQPWSTLTTCASDGE